MPTISKTKKPMFTKKTMALFQTACKALKLNSEKVIPDVSCMPEKHQRSVAAYPMLVIIIEYINGTWTPDYFNGNDKYWTYHLVKADAKRPSGFGFSYASTNFDVTYTGVGSRLTFGSREDEQKYRGPLEELYIAYKL